MPFLSKKTDSLFFSLKLKFLIFSFRGNAYGANQVTFAWIQECCEDSLFHLQSQWSTETHFIPRVAREKLQDGTQPFRSVNTR